MRLLAIRDYRRQGVSVVGAIGVFGVVFVVLKLTHVIDWSWWYVTAPFWGGLALILVAALIAGLVAMVASGFGRPKR